MIVSTSLVTIVVKDEKKVGQPTILFRFLLTLISIHTMLMAHCRTEYIPSLFISLII